ncbi:DUF3617 domain-containing protein [Leeia oryzae]|uniref:DUF3617 domain-containing protein n=1 Tax=Leeia oryzae TaxID=356662 RepID=UPI00035D9B82|nr:DUF3617 family protein [Leeia oryzae]
MRRSLGFLVLLLLLASAFDCALAGSPVVLKAGNWHLKNISTHFLMGKREKTKDRCFDMALTKDLSSDLNRLLGDQKQQCQTSHYLRTGDHLSWQVRCDDKAVLVGKVDVWLENDTHYHGTGTMHSEGLWPPGELKSEFSGVYLGECPVTPEKQEKTGEK